MAKAIFTGEQIKKLPCDEAFPFQAPLLAKLAWFTEDFFMRYCPCYASNGNCHYEKINDLVLQTHASVEVIPRVIKNLCQ